MFKKLALFLAFFSVCSTASVKAQTIVPADDGTGTIITRDGKRITIDGGSLSQNGENLFHSFQEFGLSPEQIANFLANPQLQNILSRVTGGNPSVIRGLIEVSGGNPNLYLMNPSGVIFGENARLNVPSDFTATTATGIGFKQGWFNAIGENNYSELVGTPNQFIFNTENPSAIINAGDLEVSAENNLSFFAGSVANTGTLTAKQGNITITAVPGKNLIRLSQPGQILSLEIVPPDTTAGEWNLSVYDLPALLTGNYSPEGLVVDEATATVSLKETPIPTTEGSSVIAGDLDVSGETGGNIYVLGEKIGLYEAQLSADGANGGGEIFVGGDYQGGESLPSATRNFVSDGAELSANALFSGDGGQVIVWSEGQTVFSGDISAKGGEEEGNGGLVEVSGKEALAFNGNVDVSAVQGETGTVLFDPQDIIIENASLSDNDDEISDGEILFTDGGTETNFFISDTALTNLEGNIILEASRDIIANAEANLNFENQTFGESITFTAERNLEINAATITNGADVDLTANTGTMLVQDITTSNLDGNNAGAINLTAGEGITTGNLKTRVSNGDAGAINLTSTNIDTTAGEVNSSANEAGNAGDVTFNAVEEITVRTLDATANLGTGGAVNLNSDNNISIEQLATGSTNGETQPLTITTPETVTLIEQPQLQGTDVIIGNSETPVSNFLSNNDINTQGGDFSLFLDNDYSLDVAISTDGGDFNLNSPQNLVLNRTIDSNGGNIEITGNNISSGEEVNTALDSSDLEDAGDITLNATGEIDLSNLTALVSGEVLEIPSGDGGNVTLNAVGEIAVDGITANARNSSGNGGNILIETTEGNLTVGALNTGMGFGSSGDGGDVTLSSEQGSVFVNDTIATGEFGGVSGSVGLPGNIEISAAETVETIGFLSTYSAGSGKGGDITINSENGNVFINGIDTASSDGDGGTVNVTASTGITAENRIYTGSGSLASPTNSLGEGTGGNINLTTANGEIRVSELNSSTFAGTGGEINLISETGTVDSTGGTIFTAGEVQQGNINIRANSNIAIERIDSRSSGEGSIVTVTSETGNITVDQGIDLGSNFGNGSRIELQAANDIILTGTIFVDTTVEDAGNITVISEQGDIDLIQADLVAAATQEFGLTGEPVGNGGNVNLEASGDVFLSNISTFSERSNAGNINITAGGLINGSVGDERVVEEISFDNLDVSLDLSRFTLDANATTGNGGNVNLEAGENIAVGFINTTSETGRGGNIAVNSTGGDVKATHTVEVEGESLTEDAEVGLFLSTSQEGNGGNVTVTAQGNIRTGLIGTSSLRDGTGGNLTLNSETGSVDTTGGVRTLEPAFLQELGLSPTVAEAASVVRLGIVTVSREAKGGDVTINANGDITTSNITTGSFRGEGGNITLNSENGSIDGSAGRFLENVRPQLLADLDTDTDLMTVLDYFSEEGIGGYISLSIDENAGDINLSAEGDINTNYLISSSFGGEGGNITLDTDNGSIKISSVIFNAAQGILPTNLAIEDEDLSLLTELVSGGSVNSSGVSGGEIQIGDLVGETVENTSGEITAGAINSSGRLGDGGNQTIASDQDIEVSTLNSQAGEEGQGGVIDVSTDRFFRATETFLDQGEIPASVSSLGGEGGGEITIRHGGRGEIPFIVGDAEVNGTAGEITSGEFEIIDGTFFETEREGNISIISVEDETMTEIEEERPNPEVLEEESTTTTTTTTNNTQQSVQVATLNQAKATLAEIDRASGVKPALIYLNFTPETLTGITDFQRQEARSTQDYEQYFNLSQRKADVTLSVPRQPDDQLEILLVTESGEPFRITVEDVTREQVEQTAEALYGSISSPPTAFARQAKPYLAPAQQLYNWIIEPLEATLEEQEVENLVFIMPPGLRLLPVAALHDGEQFLVENYSTGFSPSLSLTDTRYKNLQDLEVFAAGASNFDDPTALGPLPAVGLELSAIADGLWQGEVQINQEFTLENFREERRQNPKGIIHLATHADFRPGNPEDIYIQLYDRKLSLEEIRQLNLNDPPVELLVLSACRTAVGNEQVELGFAGLTVQAGVKSALASLWYVGDTGTLGLMSEFYRQLNTASIKAEAIQKAQINLINGEVRLEGSEIITPRGELTLPTEISVRAEDLSHPFYWAAFSLVGSPW